MIKADHISRQISAVIVDDEPDCISMLEKYLEDDGRIAVSASYSNPSVALEQIITKKPVLLFLDVEMPGMNGIEMLKILNQTPVRPFVIFITSFEKYTIEAIRASAFDYLLKPLSRADLSLAIGRFLIRFQQAESEISYSALLEKAFQKKLKFNTAGGFILIDPLDILFIKADYNYSEIHAGNNKKEVVVTNIGSLEEILPKGFARINRSVIINLKYLEKVHRGKRLCYLKKDNESISFNIPLRRIRDLEGMI